MLLTLLFIMRTMFQCQYVHKMFVLRHHIEQKIFILLPRVNIFIAVKIGLFIVFLFLFLAKI